MNEDMPIRRRPPPALATMLIGALIVGVTFYQLTADPAARFLLEQRLVLVPAAFAPGAHVFASPFDMLVPLIGHAFLHGGWLHLGMNMLVYVQISGPLEWRLSARGDGVWRFALLFLGSAIAGGVAYILVNPGADIGAVGASGAICGLFAGYLLGARRTWREAIRDRQIQRAAGVFLLINVVLVSFISTPTFRIAWEAHLGGFLGGLALFPLLAPRPVRRIGPWGDAPD